MTVVSESKLDQLKQLTAQLNELDKKRDALIDDIRAECPHPDFATTTERRSHGSGDEYSRNERTWYTHHYMCSICGKQWDDPSNES